MRSSTTPFLYRSQPLLHIPVTSAYLPETYSVERLNLKDKNGNTLGLYGSDWIKLKYYCLSLPGRPKPETLSKQKLLNALQHCECRLVAYLSPQNLVACQLDISHSLQIPDGDIVDQSGRALSKTHEHQNCFVIINNKLFIHPKVRASIANGDHPTIGINHTSLSHGQATQFSGSFVYTDSHGWVLENSSGHYRPQIKHLSFALEQLERAGMNLSLLTVRTWVPNCKNPGIDDSDYTIRYESAITLLERTRASKSHLDAQAKTFKAQIETAITPFKAPGLDTTEWILNSLSMLQAFPAKKSKQPFIDEVKTLFFNSDYLNAQRLILKLIRHLGSDESIKAVIGGFERISLQNPKRSYARRFFEARIGYHLSKSLGEQHHKSLERFQKIVEAMSDTPLNLTDRPKTTDDIQALFTAARKVGDNNSQILIAQDLFREHSSLYLSKDRGCKKTSPSYSAHCSIFTANQPVPAVSPYQSTRIGCGRTPDEFDIAEKCKALQGFSASNPDTPFVNSVSGTVYTLVIWLTFHIDHYKNSLSEDELNADINNIMTSYICTALNDGYHSLHEMLSVLRQPEVIKIMEEHGLILQLSHPHFSNILNIAINEACEYSQTLCNRRSLLASLHKTTRTIAPVRSTSAEFYGRLKHAFASKKGLGLYDDKPSITVRPPVHKGGHPG